MHILAFNGSPHRTGSGAALIGAVIAAAKKNGHTAETVHLYEKRIGGCRACDKCRAALDDCNVRDDMTALRKKIVKADCLIISAPVYLGQISGPMKTFLDRWCVFFDDGFRVRHLPGKKLVTIVTSGAPPATYKNVTADLVKLLTGFFKMKLMGSIMAGAGPAKAQAAALKQAERIGAAL